MNDTPHDEENRPEQPASASRPEPNPREDTWVAPADPDSGVQAPRAQSAEQTPPPAPPAPPTSQSPGASSAQPVQYPQNAQPPHTAGQAGPQQSASASPQAGAYPHQQQGAQPQYGLPQQGYGAGQGSGDWRRNAPTEDYGRNVFGGQGTQGAATAQYPPQGYGTGHGAPQGGGPTKPGGGKGKRTTGLVVASLVVGALIGGGAGGAVGYFASQGQSSNVVTSSGARNITVNNPNRASQVTAVAAKASPSIVTIGVNDGSEAGTGSGIILSDDGYVLTNTHVVTLDGQIAHPDIRVTDNNGKVYSASVVGTDPIVDLAVIKLKDAKGLTPAQFADSSKLNVGDMAVAIGAPLGLSGTVTNGIVSALNRSISIASSAAPKAPQTQQGDGGQGGQGGDNPFKFWNFDMPGQQQKQQQAQSKISLPVIQTDAAINPGNSGGALLDSDGKVIGVNVAIASASASSDSSGQSGSIGVGFSIPSDLAKRIGKEIIKTGEGSHALLGATVGNSTEKGSDATVGALVHKLTNGGPAEKAGLRPGDIVTNFNGVPITDSTDLVAAVVYLPADASTKLVYVRDGKQHEVHVTLGTLSQD